MLSVLDEFVSVNSAAITRVGIEKPVAIWEKQGRKQAEIILDTGAGMGYVARIWDEKPEEFVFGFDRVLWEGKNRGTIYPDALSVSYWNGKKWKFGLLEYQCEPKTVLPVNWNNKFWSDVFREECEIVGIVSGGGHCRFTNDGVHLWHVAENGSEFCARCLKMRPGT